MNTPKVMPFRGGYVVIDKDRVLTVLPVGEAQPIGAIFDAWDVTFRELAKND